MAIAKGKLRPKPGDPKVWFTSPESFAKVLSNRNRAPLAQIVGIVDSGEATTGGIGAMSAARIKDS